MFQISQSVCPWQACPIQSNYGDKDRSLPQSGAPERCYTWACSRLTGWKKPATDKHSRLQTFVNYVRKSFITLGSLHKIYNTLICTFLFSNKLMRLSITDTLNYLQITELSLRSLTNQWTIQNQLHLLKSIHCCSQISSNPSISQPVPIRIKYFRSIRTN